MSAYIARRIFLMLPTLLGILFVSFIVVQFAPGGPVERVIAQLSGADTGGTLGNDVDKPFQKPLAVSRTRLFEFE